MSSEGNAGRGSALEVRVQGSALDASPIPQSDIPQFPMLCLTDLADLVQGRLQFGPMPPLHGQWSTITRIALDSRLVTAGDLFWRLPGVPWQPACSTQHALFRGAAGVVAGTADIAAWPGTFCVEVDDPLTSLDCLLDWLEMLPRAEAIGPQRPAEKKCVELKDLQLYRYQGLDITPPTCGRPGREPAGSCRRLAA